MRELILAIVKMDSYGCPFLLKLHCIIFLCLRSILTQKILVTRGIPLEEGLRESAEWYLANEAEVNKKPYFDYIDTNLV